MLPRNGSRIVGVVALQSATPFFLIRGFSSLRRPSWVSFELGAFVGEILEELHSSPANSYSSF